MWNISAQICLLRQRHMVTVLDNMCPCNLQYQRLSPLSCQMLNNRAASADSAL